MCTMIKLFLTKVKINEKCCESTVQYLRSQIQTGFLTGTPELDVKHIDLDRFDFFSFYYFPFLTIFVVVFTHEY